MARLYFFDIFGSQIKVSCSPSALLFSLYCTKFLQLRSNYLLTEIFLVYKYFICPICLFHRWITSVTSLRYLSTTLCLSASCSARNIFQDFLISLHTIMRRITTRAPATPMNQNMKDTNPKKCMLGTIISVQDINGIKNFSLLSRFFHRH